MRIFLIAGKGQNGKNTIANLIKEYYDNRDEKTVITSFSKYIKLFAMEISNWDGKDETKPRALLQKIGSKIREDIREDFFTSRMKEDIQFYKMFFDNLVIADVRLPFEIEYMREMFTEAVAIRVIRNTSSKMNEEEANHVTEIALDNYNRFDFEIENNGNIEELKTNVETILERID